MRRYVSIRHLLVINALLMAVVVIGTVSGVSGLTRQAQASEGEMFLPDAASQRIEMIRELKRLNHNITALRNDLASQEFNVRVKSMPSMPSDEK